MIDLSMKWPNNENTADQPISPVFYPTGEWRDLFSDTFHNLVNKTEPDLDQ